MKNIILESTFIINNKEHGWFDISPVGFLIDQHCTVDQKIEENTRHLIGELYSNINVDKILNGSTINHSIHKMNDNKEYKRAIIFKLIYGCLVQLDKFIKENKDVLHNKTLFFNIPFLLENLYFRISPKDRHTLILSLHSFNQDYLGYLTILLDKD